MKCYCGNGRDIRVVRVTGQDGAPGADLPLCPECRCSLSQVGWTLGPKDEEDRCPECEGEGVVYGWYDYDTGYHHVDLCLSCNGSGVRQDETCCKCGVRRTGEEVSRGGVACGPCMGHPDLGYSVPAWRKKAGSAAPPDPVW